jgi:pimeloyl-ACP methyl ester carboxylesterase
MIGAIVTPDHEIRVRPHDIIVSLSTYVSDKSCHILCNDESKRHSLKDRGLTIKMPQISFCRPTTPPLFPLPQKITRAYIPTPFGPLELLIALPAPPSLKRKSPLFFAHGGCGSAAVWIPYMLFFSQRHQIPCFALSYRGHGGSWYPGFLRMYFTWMRTFAGDLACGIRWVKDNFSEISGDDSSGLQVEVVLVGHSSGGGLGQYILSEGMDGMGGKGGEKALRVKGLVLAGSIPGFGRYVSLLTQPKITLPSFSHIYFTQYP